MRKEVTVALAVTTATTLVVAAVLARRWQLRRERQWRHTQRILRKFASDCAAPVTKLWQVADSLVADMESSLLLDGNSSLNMLVSYVAALPTGNERGLYYGVNLRAKDFLILCARLGGKDEPVSDVHREQISIPSNVMGGTSQELLDYIVVKLVNFISAHPENDSDSLIEAKKLGFTVSYGVDEAAASSGSAIKWKSFSADDTVGKDLVNEINQALEKHRLNMRVSSVVNETTGDLAGGRYYSRMSVAAVTLGMGANAAYMESTDAVPSWHASPPKSGEMVISTEWGNFNTIDLPKTEFDASLDSESTNPGCQIFEKLTSGMYLGEIVRRVLVKMAQETALFGDTVPPKLNIPYILGSPDMATMHQDTSEDRAVVSEKLEIIFGISGSSPKVREVIAEVCDIAAERGARLTGAGIVGIVKKLGRIQNKVSVVTAEGGVYEHYRVFRNYLHSSVWEMLGHELSDNVIVEHSHGGSGFGAIFLAAAQTQNPDS